LNGKHVKRSIEWLFDALSMYHTICTKKTNSVNSAILRYATNRIEQRPNEHVLFEFVDMYLVDSRKICLKIVQSMYSLCTTLPRIYRLYGRRMPAAAPNTGEIKYDIITNTVRITTYERDISSIAGSSAWMSRYIKSILSHGGRNIEDSGEVNLGRINTLYTTS